MSERKAISGSELTEQAANMVGPLIDFVASRSENVLAGYLALRVAASAIERMGVDSFGPSFKKQIEELDTLLESGAAFANAIIDGKGVSSSGGKS